MSIPFPFLRNSKGKADGMWTLAALSFGVVVAMIILGRDQTSALTLFGSCAGIYWARKSTDAKVALPPPPVD